MDEPVDTDVRRGSGPAALPYVPAVIPPDPARDARVAARRAADVRRASAALDDLMEMGSGRRRAAYNLGWSDGYAACELHHNRHYARPDAAYPHPFVVGDDFLCLGCGGLESDARHGVAP